MRQRATRMILTAVFVVILVLGVPAGFLGGLLMWNSQQTDLDTRAQTVARAVERRLDDGNFVTQNTVSSWAKPVGNQPEAHTVVVIPGRYTIVAGDEVVGPEMTAKYQASSGVIVDMEVSSATALKDAGKVILALLLGIVFSILLAWYLANYMARKLSAPLIYLAAMAEQIGSGQVRAQVRPSGIEEIDLVQEELTRTGERMARRLAAERQQSADASHQLRTPLTALSMRLEEIQMLSSQEEVQEEAEACLAQVERLTTVVSDLLDTSNRTVSDTEVVQLLSVFNTEREEWEDQFRAAERELLFVDEAEQMVLAEEGKLSQILAVLIENSLKYGKGTTEVRSRKGTSTRGVFIDVSDEGDGIEKNLANEVFDMGFSEHGSSGIGLALAKDLAQSMGARLELSSLEPTVFTLALSAVPVSFDPGVVMPEAPMVSVGKRGRF